MILHGGKSGGLKGNKIGSPHLVFLSLCALKTEKAVNKEKKAEGHLGGQE